MPQVTFVDDCLVAVAVAEVRSPPDEYETDSGDDFSDREDEDVAPVTVSRSGRPIRAHFRLAFNCFSKRPKTFANSQTSRNNKKLSKTGFGYDKA